MSEIIIAIFTLVGFTVVFGALFAIPVMFLWNLALVPALPVVYPIGYFQAWGLLILSGLLFKSSNTVTSN